MQMVTATVLKWYFNREGEGGVLKRRTETMVSLQFIPCIPKSVQAISLLSDRMHPNP